MTMRALSFSPIPPTYLSRGVSYILTTPFSPCFMSTATITVVSGGQVRTLGCAVDHSIDFYQKISFHRKRKERSEIKHTPPELASKSCASVEFFDKRIGWSITQCLTSLHLVDINTYNRPVVKWYYGRDIRLKRIDKYKYIKNKQLIDFLSSNKGGRTSKAGTNNKLLGGVDRMVSCFFNDT